MMYPLIIVAMFCGGESPLILHHSDRILLQGGEGERKTVWEGNVDVTHGDARLQCDRATSLSAKEELLLDGKVRISDRQSRLRALRASYSWASRKFTARGQVRWEREGAVLSGNRLEYDRGSERTVATGDPMLTLGPRWLGAPDSLNGEPLEVRADTLFTEIGEDQTRYVARGNAHLVLGDLEGWGERAIFDRESGELVLEGTPRATRGKAEIEGHRLRMRLVDGTVASLDAIGAGHFRQPLEGPRHSQNEPDLFDEVQGDSLHLSLDAGRADFVDAIGSAQTSHYPEGEAGEMNRVNGESLHLEFLDERIRSVEVEGAVAGQYVFPRRRRPSGAGEV